MSGISNSMLIYAGPIIKAYSTTVQSRVKDTAFCRCKVHSFSHTVNAAFQKM